MTLGRVEETETATSARNAVQRAIVVCDQWLGSNGYAGMKALRRAGWSVHVAPEWEYVPVKWRSPVMRAIGRALRSRAVVEFNTALTQRAEELRPSMLLAFKGMFVMRETLRLLSSMGIRSYCFYPDVSTTAHGRYLPDALPEYDMVFTTKSFGVADMKGLGVNRATLLLHAFDPDLHRPMALTREEHTRYDCDASFIGTWSPKKESLLAALTERLPDIRLRVWGAQWDRARHRAVRRAIEGRSIEGVEYVHAIAGSAINIALLSERRAGASSGDQVTSRTFHIPAAGGFMLHERTAELLQIYREGHSVACFENEEELASAVDHYLSAPDERSRIAREAKRIVDASHSWDHRIQAILQHHEHQR